MKRSKVSKLPNVSSMMSDCSVVAQPAFRIADDVFDVGRGSVLSSRVHSGRFLALDAPTISFVPSKGIGDRHAPPPAAISQFNENTLGHMWAAS